VISAKKEIIVSAGAYRTPQLLQLSGIGGVHELEPHGGRRSATCMPNPLGPRSI